MTDALITYTVRWSDDETGGFHRTNVRMPHYDGRFVRRNIARRCLGGPEHADRVLVLSVAKAV
ncbi:hypothetical protein SLUN_19470 [Streptomyces lunaelactis]|uniref:Uncharacterized protein n=1 Tax=Streptomyces lunaelactis TaxID=1535768 RepID=A0A2R4T4L7_9ACTN|nr:hypothetical protein [Streptomyces lunaelactis]AVZ74017.1 hypothetical protein SLUN_19470 [Streptomyces lunaelactis]NUK85177.1 hypothetical protein [Streptomyces lunaelactis]